MRFQPHVTLHEEKPEYHTGISKPLDMLNASAAAIRVNVTKVEGTNPILDLKIQHSMNGVNWLDIPAQFSQGLFRRFTDTGSETLFLTAFTRFIRLKWVIGGTDAMFQFVVDALMRSGKLDIKNGEDLEFYLSLQGLGGYYRQLDGNYYDPSLRLTNQAYGTIIRNDAIFPNLAGDIVEIDPAQSRTGDYHKNYTDELYCGRINLRSFDVTQRLIPQTNSVLRAMVKLRTWQSDGEKGLCCFQGDCTEKEHFRHPDWSHVASTNWEYKCSVAPNDIKEDANPPCCSNDPDTFGDSPTNYDYWSESIYHFTRTIAEGCFKEYNTINFSFENELDNFWGGLGPDVSTCVPDGPYDRKFFDDHPDVDPVELGRHLAHHYMQAYFSFKQAINDSKIYLGSQDIKGFAFAFSDFALGLMTARWIYDSGDNGRYGSQSPRALEAAMKFSNIFFAEIPADRLRQKGMVHAYFGFGTTQEPWPLHRRDFWLHDFGYQALGSSNTIAQFNHGLIDIIMNYVNHNPDYFEDGFLIHYYSHWSCFWKVFEYLDARIPSIHTVIVEELGSRNRMLSYSHYEQPGFKCDKTKIYETGLRSLSLSSSVEEEYCKPQNTQIAELIRKLFVFSSEEIKVPNKTTLSIRSKGVLWHWMMTWAEYRAGKCSLVSFCGDDPTLPGLRYPAFEAYRFFAHIFRWFKIKEHRITSESSPPDHNVIMHLVHLEHFNEERSITAFWGYQDEKSGHEYTDVYNEELPLMNVKISIPAEVQGTDGKYYVYDASGDLEDEQGTNFYASAVDIEIKICTSPRYIFWNFLPGIQEFPKQEEITLENNSLLLVPRNNSAINACFFDQNDQEEDDQWRFDDKSYFAEIRGFTWTTGGTLDVLGKDTSGNYIVCRYNGFTGESVEFFTVNLDLNGTLRDIKSIASIVETTLKKELSLLAVHNIDNIDQGHIVVMQEEGDNLTLFKDYEIGELELPHTIIIGPGDKILASVNNYRDGSCVMYLNIKKSEVICLTERNLQFDVGGIAISSDGTLFVVQERLNSGEISFYSVDWDNLGEYCAVKVGEIPIDKGIPKGIKMSPYDTLCVSIGIKGSDISIIDEYLLRSQETSPILAERTIAHYLNPENGGCPDFALNFNRSGENVPLLRPYISTEYPSVVQTLNPRIKFQVDAENTSPTWRAMIESRDIIVTHTGGRESRCTKWSDFEKGTVINQGDNTKLEGIILYDFLDLDWTYSVKVDVIYYFKKLGDSDDVHVAMASANGDEDAYEARASFEFICQNPFASVPDIDLLKRREA